MCGHHLSGRLIVGRRHHGRRRTAVVGFFLQSSKGIRQKSWAHQKSINSKILFLPSGKKNHFSWLCRLTHIWVDISSSSLPPCVSPFIGFQRIFRFAIIQPRNWNPPDFPLQRSRTYLLMLDRCQIMTHWSIRHFLNYRIPSGAPVF